MTPHERRVFVTLALIGVQLVVLAERSRTRLQSSEATVTATKPPARRCGFSGSSVLSPWTTRESGASDAYAARGEVEYGRLVLAKITLLLGIVSLGAYNQRRLLPELRTAASSGEEPGRAAALLRRSVAFEVGLALIVLGVTSVLVGTAPPSE